MLSILVNREGIVKGALLKGKGKEEYKILEPEKMNEYLEKEEIGICVIHPDPVHEEIRIPKIKDASVRDLLIKRKIREATGSPEDFVYTCVKEKEEGKELVCEVYAFEEKLVKDFLKNSNLSIISIEPFASAFYLNFDDKALLNVFLLESENYLSFSLYKGRDVLLIRTLTVPSYVDDLNEYLFENISNFVVYARARLNLDPDLILLNGNICENEELPKKILEEFQIPVAVCIPPEEISHKDFKSLFPLLGLQYVEERYNFLPLTLKREKYFLNLLNKLNRVLVVMLFILSNLWIFTSYKAFSSLKEVEKESKRTERFLKKELSTLDRNSSYYLNYLNEYLNSKIKNPLSILPDVKDFLNFAKPNYIELKQERNALSAILYISKKFRGLEEMIEFENKFNFYKGVLTKKGIQVRIESFRKDIERHKIDIRLRLEKLVRI